MRRASIILFCAAVMIACGGAALAGPANQQPAGKNAQKSTAKAQTSDGQKVFQANCGRCHNAPEELSPREVRAVVRQMRVRANLSADDEKALIEFLAP